MAIGNMKTAADARLVGREMQNAAYELYMGIQMTGDPDPLRLLQALKMVGDDLIAWSEGLDDNEEVFVPTDRLAEIDQATAEFNEYVQKFN